MSDLIAAPVFKLFAHAVRRIRNRGTRARGILFGTKMSVFVYVYAVIMSIFIVAKLGNIQQRLIKIQKHLDSQNSKEPSEASTASIALN